MQPATVYELPLSPSYVPRWGVVESVRELLQNCIDSPAPFEFTLGPDSLALTSRGVTLDPSTLVLGVTSKAEDRDSIGSFGEGYKIALLVLTRNEKTVTIHNGGRLWTPEFRMSLQFGVPLLHVVSEPAMRVNDGLTFAIHGLTPAELDQVVESCLHMQPEPTDAIPVTHGRILPSSPGKLYVGGLYVCETQLRYGYDVQPKFIELERDRQTVDGWSLKALTAHMWFATEQHDRIAELIAEDCPDLAFAEYNSPDVVKEACYKHFVKNNPGKVIARDQKQLEELVKRGCTVYVGGGAYYNTVSLSPSYKETLAHVGQAPTPVMILEKWFEENKKYLPRLPKVAFKALLDAAKNWKA